MFFRIDEKPIGKARHRTFSRGGKTMSYDPQSEQKNACKIKFTQQMSEQGYSEACKGSFHVDMRFGMPIPKSWPKKRKNESMGQWHTSKPDIDNIAKYYLDVMNGIVFFDDNQVSSLKCEKIYSDLPFVDVKITKLGVRQWLMNMLRL